MLFRSRKTQYVMLEPPLISATNVAAAVPQEETSNTEYVYVCRIKVACSCWGNLFGVT